MNAVDLHTSGRVVGSYFDWNEWRQVEQDIRTMTWWQLDQLCGRMGWQGRFEHPGKVLEALRGEPRNVVSAAIESVKGGCA